MDQISPGIDDLPLKVVNHQRTASRRRWPWLLMALSLLGAGVALALIPSLREQVLARLPFGTAVPTSPVEANADVTSPSAVFGLGKLVPASDVVSVAPPYGASDARIAKIAATEGETVAAGQIIAILDSEAALLAAVASQKAAVDVQAAMLDQVRQSDMTSRDETQASIDGAETALETAQADYDRTAGLARRGVVAQAVLDQKRAALSNAKATLDRARLALTRYDQTLESGRTDVKVQELQLAAARATLQARETDLEKAYVRAPIAGTILTIDNHLGERPASTGIAKLADLTRMTAEIDVYQNLIARVDVGQRVTLSSEALKMQLTGKVSHIGLQVEKQTTIDSSPAANTDARVIKVHVAIDDTSVAEARRFTGLQVFARFSLATP